MDGFALVRQYAFLLPLYRTPRLNIPIPSGISVAKSTLEGHLALCGEQPKRGQGPCRDGFSHSLIN